MNNDFESFVNDKTFLEIYLKGIFTMPRAWAVKGENLTHAFEAVMAASKPEKLNFDLHDQAFMLAGMAVEVMAKAVIINDEEKRTKILSEKKEVDQKIFYNHDLIGLAALGGIDLTSTQMKTAKVLSEYIFWRGRYCIPKEANIAGLMPTKQDSGLLKQDYNAIAVEDVRDLIALLISIVQRKLYSS